MFEVVVAAVCIMLASLAGVVFIQKTAQEFLENRLSYLVSFSAGVFLVTAGALLMETLHLFDSIYEVVLYAVAGYGLAWGIHYLLPETHHHHDQDCHRRHGGARKLIAGDAIHNVADGIILVPAFLAGPVLGITVAVSIFIHELLQEISEFFVLRQNGYSTKRALFTNGAVSSTILFGVGLGAWAVTSTTFEGVLLGVSAGFFLHVVVHDLLPRRSDHASGTRLIEHILLVALGVLAMASVNVLLGDAHVHGSADNDHEAHESHYHEAEYDHNHASSTEIHEHEAEYHEHEPDHEHEHDALHDHTHEAEHSDETKTE